MIDIERLDKLQRRARTIALLALIVFLALLAVGLLRLWRVRGEIRSLEQRKAEMTAQIAQAQQEVEKLEERRRALEEQLKVLSQTISEIAALDPEPVKQAINAATAVQLKAPRNEEEKQQQEYGQEAIRQLTLNSARVAGSFRRVYLHIGNEKQRAGAGQIAEQLKRAGYIVPASRLSPGAPRKARRNCAAPGATTLSAKTR